MYTYESVVDALNEGIEDGLLSVDEATEMAEEVQDLYPTETEFTEAAIEDLEADMSNNESDIDTVNEDYADIIETFIDYINDATDAGYLTESDIDLLSMILDDDEMTEALAENISGAFTVEKSEDSEEKKSRIEALSDKVISLSKGDKNKKEEPKKSKLGELVDKVKESPKAKIAIAISTATIVAVVITAIISDKKNKNIDTNKYEAFLGKLLEKKGKAVKGDVKAANEVMVLVNKNMGIIEKKAPKGAVTKIKKNLEEYKAA